MPFLKVPIRDDSDSSSHPLQEYKFVVMPVTGVDEDECMEELYANFKKTRKMLLKKPSDISKHPELLAYFSSEKVDSAEMDCQTKSCTKELEVQTEYQGKERTTQTPACEVLPIYYNSDGEPEIEDYSNTRKRKITKRKEVEKRSIMKTVGLEESDKAEGGKKGGEDEVVVTISDDESMEEEDADEIQAIDEAGSPLCLPKEWPKNEYDLFDDYEIDSSPSQHSMWNGEMREDGGGLQYDYPHSDRSDSHSDQFIAQPVVVRPIVDNKKKGKGKGVKISREACALCEADIVTTMASLFAHSIVHLSHKAYDCTGCGLANRRKSIMQSHRKECLAGGSLRTNALKEAAIYVLTLQCFPRHYRLPRCTGPFTTSNCASCRATIHTKREAMHIMEAHPDHTVWKCALCGDFFVDEAARKAHMQQLHANCGSASVLPDGQKLNIEEPEKMINCFFPKGKDDN